MASEIRYATEENIRTLIELINAKLAEYTTADNVEAALEAYLNSEEFKKAVKDIVGDITPSTPQDPDEPDEPNTGSPSKYLKYKIDLVLPEVGEPDTLYFIIQPKDEEDEASRNRYDEYIWLDGEQTYELIGSVGSDENSSMVYQVEFILPETGKPNVIYIIPKTSEGDNRCDEYIWLENEERFELLGPTGLSSLTSKKVDSLPNIGQGNVLYLLSKEDAIEGVYEAYLWVEKAKDDLEESDLASKFGYFDFIGTIGFDPHFATDEDIDLLYDFLIKPNLKKEVTISVPKPEEMG